MTWTLLVTAGLIAFAESATGLGLFLPGEVALVTLASANTGSQLPMILVVATGAVLGDHVGYVIGRRWGQGLVETRLVQRLGVHRWDLATASLRRRGVPALLVSRVIPVVRTVMPAAAGAAAMRYPGFLAASALGALCWASLWVGAGSFMSSLTAKLGTPTPGGHRDAGLGHRGPDRLAPPLNSPLSGAWARGD